MDMLRRLTSYRIIIIIIIIIIIDAVVQLLCLRADGLDVMITPVMFASAAIIVVVIFVDIGITAKHGMSWLSWLS